MQKVKTKHRIVLLLLLVIAVCFCLCGCANVNFVTYHNADGSITEWIYLTIDEQALITHNENPSQIAIEIPTDCYTQAKKLLDEYQNRLTSEYKSSLLSPTEYQHLFNGVEIVQQDYSSGNYAIGLNYKDSNTYKKYYELLNNATFKSNTRELKKLFYTKTFYYGTANYGDYTIFNTIYSYYANSRFSTISPHQTNLTYSYSVSTRRFHSDADRIQLDSKGNYLHTWNISPNNPSQQICFYTISANKSVWIITCIGISIILTSIIFITTILSNKKQNSLKPLDNSQNIDNTIDNNNP